MRHSYLARLITALCTVAGLLVGSATAGAQVPLIDTYGGSLGYGSDCLPRNDDGSSASISLSSAFPSGLNFFSGMYTSAFVNTNGNITFNGALFTYTPNAFPVSNQPMIAPYWGDVDIRYANGSCSTETVCQNPSENGVWWYLEPGLMVVTWDRVGYYNCHNDLRMSFQLVLTEAGCGGAGDFDVEFRYNRCEWESGDASQGSGGFGGVEAQAGFDAGNLSDYVALPGSLAPGIAAALCTGSNVGTPGLWQFQIRSGSIVCPDAGLPCDTGLLGVCSQGRTQCIGSDILCVEDVTPSAEVCDALDNDCDGLIDEEDEGALCGSTQVCSAGRCAYHCVEFCGGGLVCDASTSLCVEPGCVGVECPEGERCASGGVCVGACAGVVCPFGQSCLVGNCVDLCANLTCDSCSVCEEGVCVGLCEYSPCPVGETCEADGHCVEDACAAVECPPGNHCENGTCVDDCANATCPPGQMCEAGECVDMPPGEDAGVVPTDGGTYPDAWVVVPDAGQSEPDAGDTEWGDANACNCRSGAGGGIPAAPVVLLTLLGFFLVWRRR